MSRDETADLGIAARLPVAMPEEVGLSGASLARLTAWLDDHILLGRLPGATVAIVRHGHVVYAQTAGYADLARRKRMTQHALVRIKSMTKPLTSVAAMILVERGYFGLDDPISERLPAFANVRVATGTDEESFAFAPVDRPISYRDLLTHTSGLTYGFMNASPVDALYRKNGVDFQLDSPLRTGPPTVGLAEMVNRAAILPLLSQPGRHWNYSISTDILGHLIELICDTELPEALRQIVFDPLGLSDTSFTVAPANAARLAAHYRAESDGLHLFEDPPSSPFLSVPTLHSGGGGVVSSVGDYLRFCQMLLNGGELDGTRVLTEDSVRAMRTNQLAANIDECGSPFRGTTTPGMGFGLGFSVMTEVSGPGAPARVGEFGWTGSAGTAFWIDPLEDLAVVFFTQVTPDWLHPFRRELRELVYQSLIN